MTVQLYYKLSGRFRQVKKRGGTLAGLVEIPCMNIKYDWPAAEENAIHGLAVHSAALTR